MSLLVPVDKAVPSSSEGAGAPKMGDLRNLPSRTRAWRKGNRIEHVPHHATTNWLASSDPLLYQNGTPLQVL